MRIEDRRVAVAGKVGRNDLIFGVRDDAFKRAVCGFFHRFADVFVRFVFVFAGSLFKLTGKIDDRYVGRRDAHRNTGEFAVERGDNFSDRFCSTRRRRDDIVVYGASASPVLSAL